MVVCGKLGKAGIVRTLGKAVAMSKSLKRVTAALETLGIKTEIMEMSGLTKTAQQAADKAGCHLDQIAKSVIFRGLESGKAVLFLTAGGNQVDAEKASAAAGEPLGKADAALIRAQTGFAIGGVSGVGHLNPIRAFMDPRLLEFEVVYGAAGTPRHIFPVAPPVLQEVPGAKVTGFVV